MPSMFQSFAFSLLRVHLVSLYTGAEQHQMFGGELLDTTRKLRELQSSNTSPELTSSRGKQCICCSCDERFLDIHRTDALALCHKVPGILRSVLSLHLLPLFLVGLAVWWHVVMASYCTFIVRVVFCCDRFSPVEPCVVCRAWRIVDYLSNELLHLFQ